MSNDSTTHRLRWLVAHVACGPSPTCENRNIEGDEEWGILKTTAITWSGWNPSEHKVLPEQFWGIRDSEVRAGDVLVTKAGPRNRVGVAAYVDEAPGRLSVSGKMILLRPDPKFVDSRFLAWNLSTPKPQAYLDACKTGMAESQMNFGNEDLLGLRVELPSLERQRRIADFLDAETAHIDRLQSARSRQRTLLVERQNSLLISAVTGSVAISPAVDGRAVRYLEPIPKGSNTPSQTIAPRGVLAPGAPSDWDCVPLRRIMVKLNRRVESTDSVITAYRDGIVTLRSRRRLDGYTMSDLEAGYQGVEPGDLVFHALDGFAGAVGVSDSRGKSSPVYHVGTMRGDDDPEYVALALRAMGLTGYLAIQAGNVRQRSVDFRPWESLARLPMPRPPVRIQKEISAHVASMRSWTDRVTRRLNDQTQLLAERRQALITAAVTGQFDVFTASGRNVSDGVTP